MQPSTDTLFASLEQTLKTLSDSQRALTNARFFKTTAGGYAEKEQFIGISVPILRMLSTQYKALNFAQLYSLLSSSINERRLLALLILVHQYKKADSHKKEEIFQFYIDHRAWINNWNLVDSSAPYIVGTHLFQKDCSLLLKLVESPSLWDRRIAIVSSWFFIRQKEYKWTLQLATLLLKDPEDLIHKAVGWMLREVGKKDTTELVNFLQEYCSLMPRTMLRAALEKFSLSERRVYLYSEK